MTTLNTDIIGETATDANVIVNMFQNASPGFLVFIFVIAIAIMITALIMIGGSIMKKLTS